MRRTPQRPERETEALREQVSALRGEVAALSADRGRLAAALGDLRAILLDGGRDPEEARRRALAAAGKAAGIPGVTDATIAALVEPESARFNDGLPVRWLDEPSPGGWACAVPVPGNPGGICGTPVESEPCPGHRTAGTGVPS